MFWTDAALSIPLSSSFQALFQALFKLFSSSLSQSILISPELLLNAPEHMLRTDARNCRSRGEASVGAKNSKTFHCCNSCICVYLWSLKSVFLQPWDINTDVRLSVTHFSNGNPLWGTMTVIFLTPSLLFPYHYYQILKYVALQRKHLEAKRRRGVPFCRF